MQGTGEPSIARYRDPVVGSWPFRYCGNARARMSTMRGGPRSHQSGPGTTSHSIVLGLGGIAKKKAPNSSLYVLKFLFVATPSLQASAERSPRTARWALRGSAGDVDQAAQALLQRSGTESIRGSPRKIKDRSCCQRSNSGVGLFIKSRCFFRSVLFQI